MTDVIFDATESIFEERNQKLLSKGARLLYSGEISSNAFRKFALGDTLVNTWYSYGRRRIVNVTQPLSEYRALPRDNGTFAGRGAACLYQIDLDNRRVDCGMSYLLVLGDGRIFVIDGGYFTYGECDRLYSLLKEVSPGGNIRIAGWFFSHAHQDHFGCFLDTITKYSDKMSIEGLYYNFPSLSLPEAAYWKGSDNASIREFYYDIDKYLPQVPRYILHTGDVFELAGARFEVLFTHEDIYPERIDSFNDTSTVLAVNVAGQRIIFLGDIQTSSCRKLEAMYGGYLKADIVQVSHHGFNGATTETYDLISPSVALWPTADYGFDGNRHRAVNSHLLSMECVREHIVAGYEGTVKLELPYTPGSFHSVELPKST